MSNDITQQLPPQGDNGKNEVGGLLAAAPLCQEFGRIKMTIIVVRFG